MLKVLLGIYNFDHQQLYSCHQHNLFSMQYFHIHIWRWRNIVEWRRWKTCTEHIISNNKNNNNKNWAPQGQTKQQQFLHWRRTRMKKASSLLLLSSVVAAAKDAVSSFSSCAWSVGGYGDGYRSDEINRKNVWRHINGNFRYNTGLL